MKLEKRFITMLWLGMGLAGGQVSHMHRPTRRGHPGWTFPVTGRSMPKRAMTRGKRPGRPCGHRGRPGAEIPAERAGGNTVAEPMDLRRIMQALGKDMQTVTDGISREDWGLVVKTAPRIAEHPQPPLGEKMHILGFVGSDAGRFKRFDEQTHQAAKAMEQAARRGDGQAVIASFATLQNSCLACHQNLRKAFVEHFYGQH